MIAIGLNGYDLDDFGRPVHTESKAYYLSRRHGKILKHIPEFDSDLVLLKPSNTSKLYEILDDLVLTDEERERAVREAEDELETVIKSIHQEIYDGEATRELLDTNDKLYLFCGLIMASLKAEGLPVIDAGDLKGGKTPKSNDGQILLNRIEDFLKLKNADRQKRKTAMRLLEGVFTREELWMPTGGESVLKKLYIRVKDEVTPKLASPLRLDFTGKIFNSLNDWIQIKENMGKNDVVLTPRYVTTLMVKLCRTDRNSLVWDTAMGSGGFLVSAMDIMIRDAEANIKDKEELRAKIKYIKECQLLGIEILDNIFMLAVLNMILMGDGSSNMYCMDSHKFTSTEFNANVFLLNPPYSAPGKGFNFVCEALDKMDDGYAAVLIQENAGAGQGGEYTKKLLEKNTLLASIHMPTDLFSGKSSVQAAIYVFKVNRKHEDDDLVKFIDFSKDGYTRSNRKKSSSKVNLRDSDHAKERYAEVEARVLGKKPKTEYYTKENGLYIEDTISLNGDDWTFAQHRVINTVPTEEDFKRVVADYLSWKVGTLMQQKACV